MEQLDKRRFVPVIVRKEGAVPEGLLALERKGARPSPGPRTVEDLLDLQLCLRIDQPMSKAEVATMLGVKEPQAQEWLTRLVEEGVLEQLKRPVRYQPFRRALSHLELPIE